MDLLPTFLLLKKVFFLLLKHPSGQSNRLLQSGEWNQVCVGIYIGEDFDGDKGQNKSGFEFDWLDKDSPVKSIATKIRSSCCSLKARWSIVRWAWEEPTYARAQSLGVAAHCITIYLFVCFCIFVLVFVCYKVSMWKSNIYIYMRAHSNNIHLDGCGCNLYFHVLPFVYLCICVLYGEHVKKLQCANVYTI